MKERPATTGAPESRDEQGDGMKFSALILVFLAAALCAAQPPQTGAPQAAPKTTPPATDKAAPGSTPQAAPAQQPGANATPGTPAGRKTPPQAKTQPEYQDYQLAVAKQDSAGAEKAADEFAAKYPDSE